MMLDDSITLTNHEGIVCTSIDELISHLPVSSFVHVTGHHKELHCSRVLEEGELVCVRGEPRAVVVDVQHCPHAESKQVAVADAIHCHSSSTCTPYTNN